MTTEELIEFYNVCNSDKGNAVGRKRLNKNEHSG